MPLEEALAKLGVRWASLRGAELDEATQELEAGDDAAIWVTHDDVALLQAGTDDAEARPGVERACCTRLGCCRHWTARSDRGARLGGGCRGDVRSGGDAGDQSGLTEHARRRGMVERGRGLSDGNARPA
eukprot:6174365-Pleurochrysis_carterae.AAC.1